MSAIRLPCASCRGALFVCQTPSGNCWQGLVQPVQILAQENDLVLLASQHGAMVETAGELKAWLIGQLHCWVGQHHLRDYQGVVGSFLMDMALPITICLLDYFLPLCRHAGCHGSPHTL